MSEVPPLLRGIPLKRWQMLDIERQAAEWREANKNAPDPFQGKAVSTARDGYGK